jgi:hypothetical protein
LSPLNNARMKRDSSFHIIEPGGKRDRSSATSRSYYDSRKDIIYVAHGSNESAATNHEVSHYLMHVGTPYGAFVDSLEWSETRYVISCLKHFERNGIQVPVPLYEFANRVFKGRWSFFSPKSKRIAEEAVNKYIRPWSALIHTGNLLEGRKLKSVTRGTAVDAFGYLLRSEAIIREQLGRSIGEPNVAPTESDIDSRNTNFAACPEVGGREQRHHVGARYIYESMAVLAERDVESALDMGEAPEYGYLYFVRVMLPVMAVFDGQNNLALNPDGAPLHRKDISRDRFTLYHRAFAAICDLALFSPIGMPYASLRDKFPVKSFLWPQVHPGHRILQGLLDIETLADEMEDLASGVDKLQSFLCEQKLWIEPEYFYEAASLFPVEDSTPEGIKRHLAFMALRREHPLLLYKIHLRETLTETEEHALHKFFFANRPWMHTPRFGYVIVDRKDLLTRASRFFVESANDQIMFGPKFDAASCLPSEIEYSNYFANVRDAADFGELLRADVYAAVER